MKELTKVFKKVEIKVDVLDGSNMWFDISGVANKFGKNITEWKNSKRVKEKIKLLENQSNLKMIKVSGYQTKIHRSLFVDFARWINIEFDIEADKIIMDILLGEKQLCEKQFTELQKQIEQKQKQIEQKQKQIEQKEEKIKQLSEKVYARPNGNGFETVHRIISDYGINITPHDLNEILYKRGLLNRKIVQKYVYTSNNMRALTPLVHVDTVLSIVDSLGFDRGFGYTDTHPTFDFD